MSERLDKQKVTLYLPPGLHRQVKIRAAVDSESMSAVAERAIAFYMTHSDLVDEVEGAESVGQTYRVYDCPECSSPLVLRGEGLQSLRAQAGVIADEISGQEVQKAASRHTNSQDEELVPC